MNRFAPVLLLFAGLAISTQVVGQTQDFTSPPGGAPRGGSSSSSLVIGGKVGANYAIGSMKIQPTPKNAPTNPKGLGMMFGAYMELPFSDMVGVRPELCFSFRRLKTEVTQTQTFGANDNATLNGQPFQGSVETFQETDQRLAYFQVNGPLMIKPNDNFRVMVGPAFSFLMGGKQTVDATTTIKGTVNGNQSVNDEQFSTETKKGSNGTKNFRKADIAALAGVGYTLDAGLDLDLRFYRSIVTTFDESADGSRTRVWTNLVELSMGWTFGK